MSSEHGAATNKREYLNWPVSGWPIGDQELWHDACAGIGPFGEDNPAFRWSPGWRSIIERSYGGYLALLARKSLLVVGHHPADRITPDRFTDFTEDMAARNLAPASIAHTARGLRAFASAADPDGDWHWLGHRAFRLKARAVPRRDKVSRMRHSLELYNLGLELMDGASGHLKGGKSAATQHRDGLIIALLAARPLRLSNFEGIELGRTLVRRGDTYCLVFHEEETKTGRAIDMPIPQSLAPYLESYLRGGRPQLLSKRPQGAGPTSALWISRGGVKLEGVQLRYQIIRRTKTKFGRSLNPHLFRDCLATSIATDDPEAVRSVAPILGHTTLKTSELNYNHATMLIATKEFASEIMRLRHELIEVFNLVEARSYLLGAEDCSESDKQGKKRDREGEVADRLPGSAPFQPVL